MTPMPKDKAFWGKTALLSSAGLMFPLCTALGYGWGYLMDKWLGTKPIFSIIFLLFGIAAGFINFFRIIAKIENK